MRTLLHRLFLLTVVLALGACAAQTQRSIDTLERGPEPLRVVLMPMDLQVGLLNAGGIVEPNAQWTAAADQHLQEALRARLDEQNVILVERPDDTEEDYKETQIVKLHSAVGKSILINRVLALPTKKEGFDWTVGEDARHLRDTHGADYALFVYAHASHTSAGRAALILIGLIGGVAIPGGQTSGFSSLVDLDTGDVVWFAIFDPSADLRDGESTAAAVKSLLASFPK